METGKERENDGVGGQGALRKAEGCYGCERILEEKNGEEEEMMLQKPGDSLSIYTSQ